MGTVSTIYNAIVRQSLTFSMFLHRYSLLEGRHMLRQFCSDLHVAITHLAQSKEDKSFKQPLQLYSFFRTPRLTKSLAEYIQRCYAVVLRFSARDDRRVVRAIQSSFMPNFSKCLLLMRLFA